MDRKEFYPALFPRPDTRCCAFFLAFFLLGAGCGMALALRCACVHSDALCAYLPALCAQAPTLPEAWILTARFPVFLLLAAGSPVHRGMAALLAAARGLLLAYLTACFYFTAPKHALGCSLLLLAVHGIFLLPLLLHLFTLAFTGAQRQRCSTRMIRLLLCLLFSLLAALLEHACTAPLLQFLSR